LDKTSRRQRIGGREEKEVKKKQLAKLQHDLIALESPAKALGKSANRDFAKKRALSAAAGAKISRATKKRWAKLKLMLCQIGLTVGVGGIATPTEFIELRPLIDYFVQSQL